MRTVQPYQQRVMDEKAELDDRLAKLNAFWANPQFDKLPSEEKQRLESQARVMQEYSDILAARISAFQK